MESARQRRLAAILAADAVGYSKRMAEDEAGALAALEAGREATVAPAIAKYGGRIFKLAGDGLLAEFASVVQAVSCAIEIQEAVAVAGRAPGFAYRIGIHFGDVIAVGDDLYGDGVNLAARLEAVADPGGIAISRQTFDLIEGKLPAAWRSLGSLTLKNIPKPVDVFAFSSRGNPEEERPPIVAQKIQYCRSPDGVRLAFAEVGSGPLLVKTANWLNHLEHDWTNPLFGHLFRRLSRNYRLIRYDARGNGMSDWEVPDVSLEAWVEDLRSVVDAAGVDRFALLGVSQGCAVAITFATRYPERVSRLVLFGGFALGWKKIEDRTFTENARAMMTLIESGWGAENPAFRQLFTSQFYPDATKEQADAFNRLQRETTTGRCAARFYDAIGDFDVRPLLPRIRIPTLVMHMRGDVVVPLAAGRAMAKGIPGARFVALEGRNHIPLVQDAAAERMVEEINLFLAPETKGQAHLDPTTGG